MGKLERLDPNNLGNYFLGYVEHLTSILKNTNVDPIERTAEAFLQARKNGNTIYFAGNGGSAATASHFSQDLAEVGRKAGCKRFKTLSLTDNVSFITAVGNDYGYDHIFKVQMQEVFAPGDVLVCISASGNSPNVLEAAKFAKERGGKTIGLVGFSGGKLAELCDHVILFQTDKGEYGPVEDCHMITDHLLTSYLYLKLKQNPG